MKVFSALLLVPFFVLCLAGCASAPKDRETLLTEEWQDFSKEIRRIWALLQAELTPSEAAIYKSIDVEVLRSDYVFAGSSADVKGRGKIEICTGLIRAMKLAIDAEAIEIAFGKRKLLIRYAKYVAKMKEENRRLQELNKPARFIMSPYEMARLSDIDMDALEADSQLRDVRRAYTAASLLFILYHELAHHVLGHVNSRNDVSLDARRDREQLADDWAVEKLVKKQVIPLFAKYPLLIGAFGNPNARAQEQMSDYPADVHRVEQLYDATIRALPRLDVVIRKTGMSRDQFEHLINQSFIDFMKETAR